jgi:hypothetical protein
VILRAARLLPSEERVSEGSSPVTCAEEETEEQLLAALGLKLEAELAALEGQAAGGLDARLARLWGAEERARERVRWRPLRAGVPDLDVDAVESDAARVVEFEDVQDFLVSFGAQKTLLGFPLHACAQRASPSAPWTLDSPPPCRPSSAAR